MEIKQIQVENKEWAVIFGKWVIPMSLLSNATRPAMLIVLIAAAYNIGQMDALEYLKWIAAYHGVCDQMTGQCQVCHAEMAGNRVNWICEFRNTTQAQGFNTLNLNLTR